MCVLVCVIHLSKRVENTRKRHVSPRPFLLITFFREKKVELLLFFKKRLYCGASASLSLWRSLSRRILSERSFVVYRLSDCVWWCCAFAFASHVRFLFGSGEGAFFFPFI